MAALVRAGLRNPYQIKVAVAAEAGAAQQKTPSSLSIEYCVAEGDQKVAQLLAFLQAHRDAKVIAYALTCAAVDWLSAVLPRLPGGDAMPLLALHGNMRQAKVRAACCTSPLVPSAGLAFHDSTCLFGQRQREGRSLLATVEAGVLDAVSRSAAL